MKCLILNFLIIKKNEVRCMGFKVEKTVYVNKTFRLDTKLVEQLEQICIDKKVTEKNTPSFKTYRKNIKFTIS